MRKSLPGHHNHKPCCVATCQQPSRAQKTCIGKFIGGGGGGGDSLGPHSMSWHCVCQGVTRLIVGLESRIGENLNVWKSLSVPQWKSWHDVDQGVTRLKV